MAIGKTGQSWRGEDFNDLAEYVRQYDAGGYPKIDYSPTGHMLAGTTDVA
jgi:hypothetical protein